MLSIRKPYRIPIMTKGLVVSLLLAALVVGSAAVEWYEQGNTPFLTPANFSQAVMEPNRYKFVKFFTHSCRYCRLLKQVEDELIQEEQWPFRMYDVDCSVNYDLCVAAIQPTGFPYIGIYNMKGELEAKFSGYYPTDVMRDVFRNISNRQTQLLKREGINPQTISNSPSQQTIENQEALASKKVAHKDQQPAQIGQQSTAGHAQTKRKEEEEQWSSVSEGIKILMVLFGYWMFDKMVRPYLAQSDEGSTSMRKQIQIPIYKGLSRAKSGEGESLGDETGLLMSDSV